MLTKNSAGRISHPREGKGFASKKETSGGSLTDVGILVISVEDLIGEGDGNGVDQGSNKTQILSNRREYLYLEKVRVMST